MNALTALAHVSKNMEEEQLSLEGALKEQLTINVSDKDLVDGVERLIYNHCLLKTEVHKLFSDSRPTFNAKIKAAIESDIINEPIYQNRSHLFTNEQVHALMDHFNLPKYRDNHEPKLVTIGNHKGGTGKTSTTVTLATASALDLKWNANVLVIDLDPQGSAGHGAIQISEDSIYITMVDILLSDYEPQGDVAHLLNQGHTLENIVQGCAFSTHLANLSFTTSFPSDERFVDLYWSLEEEEQNQLLRKFNDVIVPLLKDKFDLIYIDLPPQDSPLTWLAMEATEALLVPVTPRYYDYASTKNFLHNLHIRLGNLPSQGANLEWMKIAAVNYNESSSSEYETVQKLLRSARNHLFTSHIYHSEAFPAAADLGRTVLDIKKSEQIVTSHHYDLAVNSVKSFYSHFKNEIVALAAK